MTNKETDTLDNQSQPSKKEEFLNAVEGKITSDVHHRLLKAFRSHQPTEEAGAELKKIILEIIHET